MNDLLSICIPTYNRAGALRDCLESIVPQARKHDIPIYVSDNASVDDTQEVVYAAREKYPLIYYSKNTTNLHDQNFFIALKRSKSKYAWLMGDRQRINNGAIENVLKRLSKDNYDLVVLNKKEHINSRKNRVDYLDEPFVYTDPDRLLGDLGWHMTAIDTLIFGSALIENGAYEKYLDTPFMHIGFIYDYLAERKIKVFWSPEPLLYAVGESGWLKDTFETFAKQWVDLILSLPDSYTIESKLKCIKDVGVKSGIFTFKSLVYMRGKKYWDYSVYKRYHGYFPYVTNVPRFILLLISITPPIFVLMIKNIYGIFKKIRQNNENRN